MKLLVLIRMIPGDLLTLPAYQLPHLALVCKPSTASQRTAHSNCRALLPHKALPPAFDRITETSHLPHRRAAMYGAESVTNAAPLVKAQWVRSFSYAWLLYADRHNLEHRATPGLSPPLSDCASGTMPAGQLDGARLDDCSLYQDHGRGRLQ